MDELVSRWLLTATILRAKSANSMTMAHQLMRARADELEVCAADLQAQIREQETWSWRNAIPAPRPPGQ